MSPIKLSPKSKVKLTRLRRFAKGDNKDYAPMYPI